jgi:glyoxylase-like metal-dependent hydrolase (beta-lactamase superfamily II)
MFHRGERLRAQLSFLCVGHVEDVESERLGRRDLGEGDVEPEAGQRVRDRTANSRAVDRLGRLWQDVASEFSKRDKSRRRGSRMVGKTATALSALLLGAAFSGTVQAQDIKLYAFSSGALTLGKGYLQNGAPMTPQIQVPVGFFVVMHPKGNVLFDTGNNDKIITDPSYWGAAFQALKPVNTPDIAIDTQLQKISLKPDDIKYVVVSHLHLDHGGNVGKFPNSTFVVQKSEIQNAFWPEIGTGANYFIGDVLPLRSPNTDQPNAVKMLQLNGDLDLFGDGTLVVKRWVAHTPGSQMMVVRLKNKGPTILTGDNVYFKENVEKNLPPSIGLAYSPSGILSAYEWIRYEMATEQADFFTAHDPDAFKAMKKAPEFYD